MGKWRVTCDGEHFGEYTQERYARASFASACQVRPKSSYTFRLYSPNGRLIREVISKIHRAST